MMYPDTDSSNTTSSEDIEPTALVQQTVKNSRGKNRDYQLMVEGFQLMEATQYITLHLIMFMRRAIKEEKYK
ncbi:hypothetical protein BpHYR1_013163 [Brachionus plicatilis]|uniref:Uncharacterized protein n=1 Tax=Brachionus plicatilis TaxID=10195 RepID=A0A3M7T3J3_BRAPC|nr:hypothetical protein BpHYR1_013163 [Brachionus plicatilis]